MKPCLRGTFTVVLLVSGVLVGCDGRNVPTSTGSSATSPSDSHGSTLRVARSVPGSEFTETSVHASATGGGAPNSVFKVQPAPNENHVILGNSPFDVTFNMCRTEDPEGDKLLFTMDADGDGVLDESGNYGGNCRRTFTYVAQQGQIRDLTAEICVVDLDASGAPQRQPDCRRYNIEVIGTPNPPATQACAAPAPGNTSWTTTGGFPISSLTCTCSSDGTTILWFGAVFPGPFDPSGFIAQCIGNGGSVASWGPVGTPCGCS